MRIVGALSTALLISATAAAAADNPLIGTWKLKSYTREVAATSERVNERGEHPNGYLSYSPDGRMYAIITWEGRAKTRDVVPTDDERIKLLPHYDFVCRQLHGRGRQSDSSRRYFLESKLDRHRSSPLLQA